MNFFRCNCTTIEQGIELPNAILYIDQIFLDSMNDDGVITLCMEITVLLEGFQLDRTKDCVYLAKVDGNDEDGYTCLTRLNKNFYIPLRKQDDSCQQFSLNLNLFVHEGCYKLVYLSLKDDYYYQGEQMIGEWEVMGTSQQIQIQFIKNNHATPLSDLKDLTNLPKPKQHSFDQMHSVEDENPKIKYSLSKTPKLKIKH